MQSLFPARPCGMPGGGGGGGGGNAVANGAGVDVGPDDTVGRALPADGVANVSSFEETPGIAVGNSRRSPSDGAHAASHNTTNHQPNRFTHSAS